MIARVPYCPACGGEPVDPEDRLACDHRPGCPRVCLVCERDVFPWERSTIVDRHHVHDWCAAAGGYQSPEGPDGEAGCSRSLPAATARCVAESSNTELAEL